MKEFSGSCHRAGTSRNSPALALQYAVLKGAVEGCGKVIDGRGLDVPEDAAELQRMAIASLYECATAALRLAERLGRDAGPSDVASRYLGSRSQCSASFKDQAGEFFECARNFVLALAFCGQPDSAKQRPTPASSARDTFEDRLASLSATQQRAFNLLVKGLPNKLIAHELGVAESTVKAHMSALFRKLRVRSRAHAIAMTANLERQRSLASEILMVSNPH